jgi:hypothetical protein
MPIIRRQHVRQRPLAAHVAKEEHADPIFEQALAYVTHLGGMKLHVEVVAFAYNTHCEVSAWEVCAGGDVREESES